jgi:hypothetical protein
MPKGAVATLATSVVASAPATRSAPRARTPLAARSRRSTGASHSQAATSATTAAKDIWKLGPSTASGVVASTASAAQATRRIETGARSSSTARRPRPPMNHARVVGTLGAANSM